MNSTDTPILDQAQKACMGILSLENHELTASLNARIPGTKIININYERLPGNETVITFGDVSTLRNCTSCIVITALNDANNDFFELLLILDILKRNSVSRISLIISYLAYTRFYKLDNTKSCGINVISNLLQTFELGEIVFLDVRTNDILPYFPNASFVTTQNFFTEHIRNAYLNLADVVLVAPDYGVTNNVKSIAQQLNCEVLQLSKNADYNNDILKQCNLKNKKCIIIDDVLATGARVYATSQLLRLHGAGEIDLYVTHFLSNTLHIPNTNLINRIITTNSIPQIADLYKGFNNIQIVNIADLILGYLA